MTLKQIDAILWRSYLKEASKAIWGDSNSQYYFEVAGSDLTDFFGSNFEHYKKDGNDSFVINLEEFEGADPAEKHKIHLTLKADTKARKGMWVVNNAIRDGSNWRAYDLWRQGRGPIARYDELTSDEKSKNYIVIARDVDGGFHGRWIRGSDFDALPMTIQEALKSKGAGWREL